MKAVTLLASALTIVTLSSCGGQGRGYVVCTYRYESFANLVSDLNQFNHGPFESSYLFNPESDDFFSRCSFRYSLSGLTSDYPVDQYEHPYLKSIAHVMCQIKADSYLAEIRWFCNWPFEGKMSLVTGFSDEDPNSNTRYQVFDQLVRGEGDWYSPSEEWKFGFSRKDYQQFSDKCFYALNSDQSTVLSGYAVYSLDTPAEAIETINARILAPLNNR